jgi:hypothetical protein
MIWIGWRGLGLALLGLAQVWLLVQGSQSGSSAGHQLTSSLSGNVVGVAALLWIAAERRFERVPLWAILTMALLLRVLCTQAAPLLEDDHFRYLWDGMRTATTGDPYRLPPAAFFGDSSLPTRWQDILSGINNPHLASIYGPLLQGVFAVAYWLTPAQLSGLQGLLLCADMAVLCVLATQTWRRTGRHGSPVVSPRWLLAYALHPLLLREGMASAHPDILVGLLLLCSVLAWQAQRVALTGVLWGLAVCCKVSALVVLPVLLMAPAAASALRWGFQLSVAGAVTIVLTYLPFVWGGASDLASLRVFGSSWRFNPWLYRGLEAVVPAASVRAVAAVMIVLSLLAVVLWWRRGGRSGQRLATTPPVDGALIALLIWSPVINPWYWLWALPVAVLRGNVAVAAVAGVAAVSYINSTVMSEAGWPGGFWVWLAGPQPCVFGFAARWRVGG